MRRREPALAAMMLLMCTVSTGGLKVISNIANTGSSTTALKFRMIHARWSPSTPCNVPTFTTSSISKGICTSRAYASIGGESDVPNGAERISAIEDLAKMDGPGHTSSFPLSTAQYSRLEVARFIVAIAILWLTVKMKTAAFTKQLIPADVGDAALDATSSGMSSGIVELDSGIRYQDIIVGSSCPNTGELVSLDMKLFFNGLEIKKFDSNVGESRADNRLKMVKFGQPNALFNALSLSGLNEPDVLNSMRLGGRRKVTLPSEYAFGSAGFPPYVPPNATVLVDLIVVPR